jgi:hypothetical protein
MRVVLTVIFTFIIPVVLTLGVTHSLRLGDQKEVFDGMLQV